MRRILIFLAAVLALSLPAAAQIGKSPMVRAGTEEDRALLAIDNATDPAQKLALLDQFLANFGQTDLALLAYERYMAHYLGVKDYAKVFEYGEKALALDPDHISSAVTMVRAAQEMGDTAKAFEYGERIGAMLERYKAAPPPEGMDEMSWRDRKAITFERLGDQLNYVYYTLYSIAYQTQDLLKRAGMLERYASMFPDSPYTSNAESLVAASYQQAQDYPKMLEFAQKVLQRDAENLGMLILLADYWSERGEELEKAEEYGKKALELLEQAQKPEQVTEEQWEQQKGLQRGLVQSALGQIEIRKGNNREAVEAFKEAAPLLKPDPLTYARNQYRLGFALLNLRRTSEARAALTEAASVDSPYKALAQQKLNEISASRRRP